MIARFKWALGGAAVLALAACSSPRAALAPAPVDASVAPITAETNGSGMVVTVRWPSRQVQTIPDETTRIVLQALRSGTLAKQVTLERPAGAATSTASLKPLAFGSYTLAADAYDASDVVVASGSVSVAIAANELVKPSLTLSLVDHPVLTSMSQVNGIPGESVVLRGTGFGASKSRPYSVYVGSVQASAVRSGDDYLTLTIPAAATNSPVIVNVGTGTVQSTASFFTIRSLTLGTTSITVTAPGSCSFSVTARDHNNAPIASPVVPWNLESPVCSANCQSAPTVGTIDATGLYQTNGELGTVVVRAGRAGSVTATGSITVQ